jgi:O-antigen/teichoic acid export membrane protein
MLGAFWRKNFSNVSNLKVNTILSFIFRGGSIFLQFLLVPLSIKYINASVYGVWLTLSSIIGWMNILDIGIANGLKNKLTESLAKNDFEKSRIYVSTTYIIIGVIALILGFVFFLLNHFISWQEVFNSKFIPEQEIEKVVGIVYYFFLLKLITDIINIVAASFQMVSVSALLLFLSNLGATLAILILTKTSTANLVLLAFCFSAIPFLVSVFASIYFFKNRFKIVKPSFKYVKLNEFKSIAAIGTQFFILQMVAVVIFQTDNIVIAQFYSPSLVTNFNVAYKYYSTVIIIFSIILSPFWTAFTESYVKGNFDWIKLNVKRLTQVWLLSIFILFLMFFCSRFFFNIWVGSEISISSAVSLNLIFYIIVLNWSSIFSNFLNGVGIIKLQVILAPLVAIINILLSIIFVKIFRWDIFSIPLANSLSLLIGAVFGFIQYRKIITNSASGIWMQ